MVKQVYKCPLKHRRCYQAVTAAALQGLIVFLQQTGVSQAQNHPSPEDVTEAKGC